MYFPGDVLVAQPHLYYDMVINGYDLDTRSPDAMYTCRWSDMPSDHTFIEGFRELHSVNSEWRLRDVPTG